MHAILLSADFFQNQLFSKNDFRKTMIVSKLFTTLLSADDTCGQIRDAPVMCCVLELDTLSVA